MRRIYAVLISLLFSLASYAQLRCSFTHYSIEDGLSQKTIMNILEDRNGFMWFATWDGINKFDGYTFTTYKAGKNNAVSFANNRVDYIYEDPFGYLWIMTYDNRFHRFDPKREIFTQVPASGIESNAHIHSIKILPNGHIWLLTENEGAYRVIQQENDPSFELEIYSTNAGNFPVRNVSEVLLDEQQTEWLLTDNGLWSLAHGSQTPVSCFMDAPQATQVSHQAFYCYLETNNEIWFGSDKGRIWKYNKLQKNFELKEFSCNSQITAIHRLAGDELMLTSGLDGFFTYDSVTEQQHHYTTSNSRLPGNQIANVYVDRCKEVWLDIDKVEGVSHFNPFTRQIKHETIPTEQGNAYRSQPKFHILEDVNGYLWVHPFGGGLSYFDRDNNQLRPFYNEPGADNWRFSNKLHSIMSDREGNLWMSTHSKGLEKISFFPESFSLVTPEPLPYESLINDARSMYEDHLGRLWLGTKEGKIRIYNSQNQYLGYLTADGKIAQSGKQMPGVAYHIMQDQNGNYWISTKGDGLIQLTGMQETFRVTHYKHDPNNIYSLSDNNIYCTHEDRYGRIWIATFGGGLNYLEPGTAKNNLFIHHKNNLKGWPIDHCYRTRVVTSDHKGNIWVGSTSGAISFSADFTNPETIVFNHHYRKQGKEHSLSNNDVYSILNTKDNNLYLATFGGGLNKLLSLSEDGEAVFKFYTVKDGLPSDVLLCIEEDEHGHLWISTENGLCKFDTADEHTENYDDNNFNFRAGFNEGASFKKADGEMLFGTSYGMLIFTPDTIRKSAYVPPVAFTRFQIANEDIHPATSSRLEFIPNETHQVILSHKDNIFTIRYAALDMKAPDNIRYAYMLEGFDRGWNYVDKQRAATYTNLPKGDYIFKVRSTNSDGIWVENTRQLAITVLPSFWETPWAYILYILLIMGVIFITVYILFTIYRLKHEVFVEQQISDIKLRFFTNISHELRTPLTLISGPVEHVLNNSTLTPDIREQLQLVERNTSRMLRLINQILDFRKIQNKKMKMRVQRVDLVQFVRRVMDNFESLAEVHRIDFILETENKQLYLWLDIDKLEKIVFNLVSNAFKYTPQEKMIKVFIREEEETVSLGVEDQGIGIAENRKESIFVRFENLMDKSLFDTPSTGIGLSLVKELVEMHQATITVESKLGKGSIFLVTFHKGKEHFDETTEFILTDYYDTPLTMKPIDEVAVTERAGLPETAEETEAEKQLMLIVEDNDELRGFLKTIFISHFRVAEAADGNEGLYKAEQLMPNIIISDVMMPGRSGIEIVQALKGNLATSHIPVVLLTAKSSTESKLKGLEYGADDYIAKPFSSTYLQARVENLLTQRRKLQELYRSTLISIAPATDSQQTTAAQPETTSAELSPNDRKFMEKLVELMEQNMNNDDLVVNDLVKEMAVSRSVFFKKLKALTGLAPVEFIKEMRITRAAQLIETGEFTMTQIACMVGINDSRYFSKCFKQMYGMTPTKYKEQKFY
ncbi:MAG: response regulator [Tannerellaceae bacterium]|nr:response regulator [Tannerellaceae bacterium]